MTRCSSAKRLAMGVIAAAGFAGSAVAASLPGSEQRVVAMDDDASDWFGRSVDVFGDMAVVGAPGDDEVAAKAGAIYLLERDLLGVWQPGGKFLASDVAINKEYGEAVAIEGGTVIVGGSEEDAVTSGAAYIYSSRLFADGFESGDTSRLSATSL